MKTHYIAAKSAFNPRLLLLKIILLILTSLRTYLKLTNYIISFSENNISFFMVLCMS